MRVIYTYFLLLALTILLSCQKDSKNSIKINAGQHISLIGNSLCARMILNDHFESILQCALVDSFITIRNMCDAGDTPSFRPHSGRNTPWAIPHGEQFHTEMANSSGSEGHLAYPDEWLTGQKTDIVLAFFGYNEAYESHHKMDTVQAELDSFVVHTLSQKYNGKKAPQLILISPIAFEDLSEKFDLPDGSYINPKLKAYTAMMQKIAMKHKIPFIDLFAMSQKWYGENDDLTIDGFQLNDKGNKILGQYLVDQLIAQPTNKCDLTKTLAAVNDKNWFWENLYKIPNGVHVFGRRYNPFGQDNYPFELKKLDEMCINRDSFIWAQASGKRFDLSKADGKTTKVPSITTNYNPDNKSLLRYLSGAASIGSLRVPYGYKIELFASEETFPDLAKPVQMSFDNKGRLWVAVMPSYPHYKPGDGKPNDKLIILEDTNNDGRADKQTTFADKLHLPIGFELAEEGVYVSQGSHLKLLRDINGDDKCDVIETLLSGFDDHDTHHAISAFCADPSGAITMLEGTFLHSNVETSYGPVRATNGGMMRYNPSRKHLERLSQIPIPNPWGIGYDDWGQPIFAETSGPDVRWLMPSTMRPVYGKSSPTSPTLVESTHMVRPTSGFEFVSSRHFPDDIQGDYLINNTIGFLGTKQHTLVEDGTGYASCWRQDLISSSDPNFRPVDMEFAPDGSLYVIDWHNILIGHMQHNARDPLRDHSHGRIYRVTYPSRPLITPSKIDGQSIDHLLDLLKLPEYRTRYRAKRELRGRNQKEVLAAVAKWVKNLDKSDAKYDHHILEAMWVTWGVNKVSQELINQLLASKDHRARAAAINAVRYNTDKLKNHVELLTKGANDIHGRVRLESLIAASWLSADMAKPVIKSFEKHPIDLWMKDSYEAVVKNFKTRIKEKPKDENKQYAGLSDEDVKAMKLGEIFYYKDGYCSTCHQADGKGLPNVGYPPLALSEWVLGDESKLIKLTLHGLMGPMTVRGIKYDGKVPMLPFGKLMTDEEIAAVLTFVRKSFGNNTSSITKDKVRKVREETKGQKGYINTSEL
jgi:mono/diheme cytochrome c family protein/glucose/arabinose dehydrogenase